MITAVDTNVLLDILLPDPKFGPSSKEALAKQFEAGSLIVCSIVYSELSAFFESKKGLDQILLKLGIRYSAIEEDSAYQAGSLWQVYASRSGKRARVLADFLIGAHAKTQADSLLTRDRGFYRDYFKDLAVIEPRL